MKVSILCNLDHPITPWLHDWVWHEQGKGHAINVVSYTESLRGGDVLFLISCPEIIGEDIRNKYGTTLVLHASNLPQGRGWSPHVWQILEGKRELTVSMLEAEDRVDSGTIWATKKITIPDHYLVDEINRTLFEAELELMQSVLDGCFLPESQKGQPSYYRKRTPEDSRINPDKSIAEQFDLLRVCDPERYPAFFDLRGHRYKITLEKMET